MKAFLPNFIFMTNFCEVRGYEFNIYWTKKGVKSDLYFQKELFKKGIKYYNSCIEAQKHSYTTLYKKIIEKL